MIALTISVLSVVLGKNNLPELLVSDMCMSVISRRYCNHGSSVQVPLTCVTRIRSRFSLWGITDWNWQAAATVFPYILIRNGNYVPIRCCNSVCSSIPLAQFLQENKGLAFAFVVGYGSVCDVAAIVRGF